MNWCWLNVSSSQRVRFEDGVDAAVEVVELTDEMGRRTEAVHLSLAGWGTSSLVDVIDTSGGIDESRIGVIQGDHRSALVLLGGAIVYRVHSSGWAEQILRMNRDQADEEYWTTDIMETRSGVVVVYEGGVFLVSPALEIGWHRKKLYSDLFDGLKGDGLSFHSDGGDQWTISVQDGSTLEPSVCT